MMKTVSFNRLWGETGRVTNKIQSYTPEEHWTAGSNVRRDWEFSHIWIFPILIRGENLRPDRKGGQPPGEWRSELRLNPPSGQQSRVHCTHLDSASLPGLILLYLILTTTVPKALSRRNIMRVTHVILNFLEVMLQKGKRHRWNQF